MTYDLEYLFEAESTRTTAQVADMLDIARWKLGAHDRMMNDPFLETHDGVLIEWNPSVDGSRKAAMALAAQLSGHGIQATAAEGFTKRRRELPSPIVINVGLKPTDHFGTPKPPPLK